MAELKVKLSFIPNMFGEPGPYITINGLQPLAEGPRKVGHCCYCKGPCDAAYQHCEPRVWGESRGLRG